MSHGTFESRVAQTLTLKPAAPTTAPQHSLKMTSSAMAFLEEQQQQQAVGSRGHGTRPSTRHEIAPAAAAPREYPVVGEEDDDIQSDLVPSANTFIRKLYQMVTNENNDIIAFTADGLSFHVKDPARLESEILPKYFRHSRFQSLVRQLNFYDFKKISKERIIWIYRHKLFQQQKPHLLDDLKRKPSASLVKSRTESITTTTVRRTSSSGSSSPSSSSSSSSSSSTSSKHAFGSNSRAVSAAGGVGRRNGGVGRSLSPDSGTTSSSSSSDSTPSTSPGRDYGPKKRKRFQQQQQPQQEEDSSSFTSVSASYSSSSLSSSSFSSYSHHHTHRHQQGRGGVTNAGGLSCLETLTHAAASVGQKRKKEEEQQQQQRYYEEEEEEDEEGWEGGYYYQEDAMEFSYWQAPSHEKGGREGRRAEEEEAEIDEQEEEEACWVMKKMMMGKREQQQQQQQQQQKVVVEEGFEEGMQELPEDEEVVLVMPAEKAQVTPEDKLAPPSFPSSSSLFSSQLRHPYQPHQQQHQMMYGHQEEKTDGGAPESSYSSYSSSSRMDTRTPLPSSSFCSSSTSSSTPPSLPTYNPTPEEHVAWAKVQSYWNSAGPSLQHALIASLPSQVHQAWTSFLLVIPPFQSQELLIHACHCLLSTSPALAVSVHEHRLALDPLAAASPDKTFFLQEQQQQQQQQVKEKEAGHNDRALREVLGFGLNHLMEAARSLSPLDVSQAAMALRECLQAWKGHTGRLL